MPSARVSPPDSANLRLAGQVRVIYADTDKMGIVYHGTYTRYLEQARVELMRGLGVHYAEMERRGFGLPLTDLAIRYLAPARYDDVVSLWAGLSRVSYARLDFEYELAVEPGDRYGEHERIVVLHAETRHGCVDLHARRATRIPDEVYETLQSHANPENPWN